MKQQLEQKNIDFVNAVEDAYQYLKNGGTPYRKKTAELSLKVAKHYNQHKYFLDYYRSIDMISDLYPLLDEERLNDVAKFLYTIARKVEMAYTLPDDVKKYVEERRKYSWRLEKV